MKFKGTVGSLESTGEGVAVKIDNVRQKRAAGWREYSPSVTFKTSNHGSKPFVIDAEVEITLKVKR